MFENLEKRRKNTLWKAFGITATLFALGLWLIVHWREQREKDRYEEEHEKFQHEVERREQPQRIQLPGMSIVAPSGEVHTTGDYLEGKASTSLPYSMQLTWRQGAALPDAASLLQAEQDARIVVGEVHFAGDRATTLGGAPAHEYRFRSSTRDVFLTYGSCGERRITLAISGGALHAEDNAIVAKTFECKPDKSIDLTRRDVVVDAKDGWKRVDPDDRPLALSGPGGVRVLTYHFDRFAVEGSLADFVARLAPTIGLHVPDKNTTRNDKLLYMGRSDNGMPAALVTFRCPDDSVAMVAITGGASLNPGIELADSGRCLQLGDPMPRY